MTCKLRICAHCALFSVHKNHEFKQEQEVINEISLKAEILITMFQGLEDEKNQLKDTSLFDEKYALFREQQDKVKIRIQDRFKQWRKALKDAECAVLESLHTHYLPSEELFQEAKRQTAKVAEETDHWLLKTKVILDEYMYKQENDPQYIAFEMLETPEELINHGDALIEIIK